MRLEKIKLSGFKSFVDPTTIPIPVNLVGIAGPNGCGKSNIIDAVRWVMGESSAKNLRGGSMTDVIFNGSASRKPISKASVELVFDNSDGAAGGEFSKYSQLSIKRQITRDGQSTYRLNGTKCRRRDITDIFLGTGLGPRSYAIIEQGMISRLIEAKPEELRVFLEEAAGVSKYKERRHETELRMRHTRENLERLNDLREALSQQVERLKRQAKTAERYKSLRSDQRRYKRELLAIRWQGLDEQLKCQKLEELHCQNELEKLTTEQQRLDIATEEGREHFKSKQKVVDELQAQFYELGSKIGRIEQNIRHAKSQREQRQNELAKITSELERDQFSLVEEKNRCVTFNRQKSEVEAELKIELDNEKIVINGYEAITRKLELHQAEWEQFISHSLNPKEQLKSQQSRLRHLELQQQQLGKRAQRLKDEQAQLNSEEGRASVALFQTEIGQLEQQSRQMQAQVEQLDNAITTARELDKKLGQEISSSRTALQSIAGRIAGLEKIIEHATGRDRVGLTTWLKEQSLENAPRLIEQIEVEKGWETAVEIVLSEFLEAICIEGSKPTLEQLQRLREEGVALIENGTISTKDCTDEQLLGKVVSPWPLEGVMGTIFCAESLSAAHERLSQLKNHQSIITRDGIWMGKGWLLKKAQNGAKTGLLQKEKELKLSKQEAENLIQLVDEQEIRLQQSLSKLKNVENEQSTVRSGFNELISQLSTKKSRQAGLQVKLEHNMKRQSALTIELDELSCEEKEIAEERQRSLTLVKKAESELLEFESEKGQINSQHGRLKLEKESADQSVRKSRVTIQQLRSCFESLKTKAIYSEKNSERIALQLDKIEQRIAEIKQPTGESDEFIAKEEGRHYALMDKKVAAEKMLQQARQELSFIESETRQSTEKRGFFEIALNEQRASLEKIHLLQERTRTQQQTTTAHLKEVNADLQTTIEALEKGANEADWQNHIELLVAKIERLGTINLAAIEEHEALSERIEYLTKQHEDLRESLSMLEQAIGKIDQETKTLFKETFNKVNSGFQEHFPKLFGGGRAYLSLDDQDLLSTGVSVMASPPGKRNSTIHQLSGGEKALTAVALVFSIFDLNPAPFCLLDEVDAPLDDANVGRFSELVKEMSETVQFLFISHNKTTMEIAQHLAGVTMSEPGISRMVSVDIDEAVKLAAL